MVSEWWRGWPLSLLTCRFAVCVIRLFCAQSLCECCTVCLVTVQFASCSVCVSCYCLCATLFNLISSTRRRHLSIVCDNEQASNYIDDTYVTNTDIAVACWCRPTSCQLETTTGNTKSHLAHSSWNWHDKTYDFGPGWR